MKNLRCAVLVTCHDRPNCTIPAVLDVTNALRRSKIEALIFVIDSSEGFETGKGLADINEPGLRYTRVSPDVFWARGMKIAEGMALSSGELSGNDLILWLNDDVVLTQGAISLALKSWKCVDPTKAILVGATREKNYPTISYTGKNRLPSSPTSFANCVPSGDLSPVGTFNGNFVWMSVGRARYLGGIEGSFAHHGADIEYGIRNELNDGWNFLLSEPIGFCSSAKKPPPTRGAAIWHLFSPLGTLHFGTKKILLERIGFSVWSAFFFAILEIAASAARLAATNIPVSLKGRSR